MKNKYWIFFLLIIGGFYQPVHSFGNYKFRTLSPDGGFYYDGIKWVEQSKDGFVWIVMDYELYRFDGFEYKKYSPYFVAMDPEKRWIFNAITSDSCGNLYVNTNNGLYYYERETDCFEKIYETVSALKVGPEGHLWVWINRVWSMLDTTSGELFTPPVDGAPASSTTSVFCTYHKDLYIFVNQKVYRYNYAKREFVFCFTLPHKTGYVRFAQASQGKLWVFVHKNGLYKVDLSTFEIEDHYRFLYDDDSSSLRDFHIDKNGYAWYGTIHGIYILDPQSRQFSHYVHSGTEPFSLPGNSVWSICEDRQQNVWIGTYTGALCYVNLDEGDAFKTFLPYNSGLNHMPVSAFSESENYLWVGTEGGGVNRMDKQTGTFTFLTNEDRITSNIVKSMATDANQNLWISMFKGGLDYYDRGNNKIINYRRIQKDANSLLVDDIRKIVYESSNSGLWIAYQHFKPTVSYFSLKDHSFTHYELDAGDRARYLFDILRQGERYLWAISNEQLYRLDIATSQVDKVIPDDSAYLGLCTFCLDDSGNIWIGTIGNGLIKCDTNTLEITSVKNLTTHDIYSIYSICYDDGVIWMGTDDGLHCYNIQKEEFQKFDKSDGTQGQVYYPLASMKGKDGKLYFGGTNGFTIIDPKKITRNRHKPQVIISDFFIDHKPSYPDYIFKDSVRKITLSHDQANFGFKFSSDNFLIPEKNTFKYRLKGYDDRWIEVNASNRMAMYSKVPAGAYSFEVLTANNDGVWGDTPLVIKIKRKPAPWLSWPAYILYMLLIAGVLFLIYRYYSEKKRLKMQLYLENVEKEKKEQIHQSQLRFFTNISHDFRTPLSLIIAALDKLRREGLKEYYYRILNGNAQRLLNLVNELMDFRTVENGKMQLKLHPLQVNDFVQEIAAVFTDYAEQRNMTFRIKCDEHLSASFYADKNILEKIVMNLLNNAFKYTPEGGTVILETQRGNRKFVSHYKNSYIIGKRESEEVYAIIVRDTGVGISEESISSVFERFYKVNTVNTDAHLGTGIGLALVKSLVLLCKGTLSIYSERNKGTDLVVELPADSSVFAETDFLKLEDVVNEAPDQNQLAGDSNPEDMDKPDAELEDSTKKKILIAEDNEDLRHLIAESLSESFLVTQASDGLEALRLIDDMDFDLVISDIMMPHKDGISLCNDLKNDMNTSHIPVVLLTAKTGLESKLEGVDSGADLYLEKPVDLNYLNLSLQNIFRNQQQLKDHYAKNYYADSSELSSNEQDNKFLKRFTAYIEENIDHSDLDINQIGAEFSMSRSKLYIKVKSLTGKSVVEFVLNYRLRKAAKLIIEEDLTMKEVMMQVGIESQSYFTNAFKKVFGETPTSFASKHKKKK